MLIRKIFGGENVSVVTFNEAPNIETVKQNILNRILNGSRKFQLMVHNYADADAIGSALAMKALIETMVQGAQVKIFLGEINPEVRQMVADNQQAFGELPDAQQYIALDVSSLNTVVLPETQFDQNEMTLIDHHLLSEDEKSLDVLNSLDLNVPERAACAVLVYELYTKAKEEISLDVAKLLYTAIYKDSGNFSHPDYKNSPESQQVVAELTEILIDAIGTAGIEALLKTVDSPPLTAAEQKEWNQVIDKYTVSYQTESGQDIILSLIPRGFEVAQRYRDLSHNFQSYEIQDLKQQEVETLSYLQVDNKLSEKIPTVVVVVAKQDGLKFSIRTTDKARLTAKEIMSVIGGGGHDHAAGGFVSYSDFAEKVPLLLSQLNMTLTGFNKLIIEEIY